MFLLYVVEEEDTIGFSWLLCWYLPMLRTLLPEVSGVVPFCVCE